MKKFFAGLAALVVLAAPVAMLAESTEGCTKQEDATVLSAIDQGCVDAELIASQIPANVLPSVVVQDIEDACDLSSTATPMIETIITAFIAKLTAVDGGFAAAGLTYHPASWAVGKIAAKRLARARTGH